MGSIIIGFFKGLFLGFIGFIIFGLPASLFQSSYSATNFWGFLASLCVLGGPIVGIVSELREGKNISSQNSKIKEHRQMLERELPLLMNTIRNGYNSKSVESVEKYYKACDTMIFYCAKYFYINDLRNIVNPYKNECYLYTFLKYENGSYKTTTTSVGEEIHKEIELRHLENRTGLL